MVDKRAHEGHCRQLAPCWHQMSFRVRLSCSLSCEALKAYRALFFETWT